MATHYLGLRIRGQLCRFFGTLTEDRFAPIAAKGLPSGWVAWHIEDEEKLSTSKKMQELRNLPLVCKNGESLVGYISNDSMALPLPLAHGVTELENAYCKTLHVAIEINMEYQLTKNRSEFLPVDVIEDGPGYWCVCVSVEGIRAGEIIAEGFTTQSEAISWCNSEHLPILE